MSTCTEQFQEPLRICKSRDHEIVAHYKDMVTNLVMSFENELPRTLYVLSLVMKKYVRKGYREDMYYALQDLYPDDSNVSYEEFERVMRHSIPLGMFERRSRGNLTVYCLC